MNGTRVRRGVEPLREAARRKRSWLRGTSGAPGRGQWPGVIDARDGARRHEPRYTVRGRCARGLRPTFVSTLVAEATILKDTCPSVRSCLRSSGRVCFRRRCEGCFAVGVQGASQNVEAGRQTCPRWQPARRAGIARRWPRASAPIPTKPSLTSALRHERDRRRAGLHAHRPQLTTGMQGVWRRAPARDGTHRTDRRKPRSHRPAKNPSHDGRRPARTDPPAPIPPTAKNRSHRERNAACSSRRQRLARHCRFSPRTSQAMTPLSNGSRRAVSGNERSVMCPVHHRSSESSGPFRSPRRSPLPRQRPPSKPRHRPIPKHLPRRPSQLRARRCRIA